MNYESLLEEAKSDNLIVKEKPLLSADGRIKGNRIAIRRDIPTARQKSCVLAEELGHHYTTSGNILDLSVVGNRKQERRARIWAYNKQIGLRGLVKAYENGCRNKTEIAEYLEVTEEFLIEAIECYEEKYGVFATVDNYVVYFSPFLTISKSVQ